MEKKFIILNDFRKEDTYSNNNDNILDCNLLITPISKKYKKWKPCSRKDWEDQMIRSANFKQMMWDDSSKNKSKIGDIFIAWYYKRGVSFHRITDVHSPSKRLKSWSNNVGHSNRNVIFISREFASINWEEWIKLGGHPRCMGTSNIISAKKNILCALLRKKVLI